MMADISTALAELKRQELSIIRLSAPITAASTADGAKRTSDVSTDALESPSPASLAASLNHYKELFSKLRFSYLEQVTKEKFLRAIVGDPPQVVEHQENIELEAQLVGIKADLKAQKEDVAGLVADLEAQGRELSKRYENITLQTTQLSALPSSITSLQTTIAALRAAQVPPSQNPSLSLPLPATLDLLSAQNSELNDLGRQIKRLQGAVHERASERQRLEGELRPLEGHRAATVAAAEEAQRRKREVERGVGDELELRGRWYRSVEVGLRDVLGVEG